MRRGGGQAAENPPLHADDKKQVMDKAMAVLTITYFDTLREKKIISEQLAIDLKQMFLEGNDAINCWKFNEFPLPYRISSLLHQTTYMTFNPSEFMKHMHAIWWSEQVLEDNKNHLKMRLEPEKNKERKSADEQYFQLLVSRTETQIKLFEERVKIFNESIAAAKKLEQQLKDIRSERYKQTLKREKKLAVDKPLWLSLVAKAVEISKQQVAPAAQPVELVQPTPQQTVPPLILSAQPAQSEQTLIVQEETVTRVPGNPTKS